MHRLIHLSDIHFGIHDQPVVEAVEQTIKQTEADLVICAGDVTQWADPEEFEQAKAWLDKIEGHGHEVLVVPGNHDVPSTDLVQRFLKPHARWDKHMGEERNPWIERPGLAILGLNTARGLVIKNGKISDDQIALMRERFAQAANDALRILVCHHPLWELPRGAKPGDAIQNQMAAVNATDDVGIDLVLTGHNHTSSVHRTLDLPNGDGTALAIQAGTAFSTRIRTEPPSFNIIHANRTACAITVMGWDGDHYVERRQHHYVREHDEAHWQVSEASVASLMGDLAQTLEDG
ncbi:metallophosphoesterase family protein [Sphingomicrobium flavum]|uniref:metallophosphoesterase family protein n=1 Tax=Sphingomicrobium flavum TaxID=1229164 RepID=UPI0021AD59E4|nr:metallophosphoesterase [Sphingomicrobium flavum]